MSLNAHEKTASDYLWEAGGVSMHLNVSVITKIKTGHETEKHSEARPAPKQRWYSDRSETWSRLASEFHTESCPCTTNQADERWRLNKITMKQKPRPHPSQESSESHSVK